MRMRLIVATLGGALLVFGTPRGVMAQGNAGPGYTRRCGHTHYCSEECTNYPRCKD
jgi:hypothetical protein